MIRLSIPTTWLQHVQWANTHLILVRSQLAKWNGSEQDLWPTFSGIRQHANRGSYLEWKDHLVVQTDTGCSHVFFRDDIGDGVRFLQGLYCYGSSWQPLLSFTQEYQPSLWKKCFSRNNSLVCLCLMTWWEKLSTLTKWWIYSVSRLGTSISYWLWSNNTCMPLVSTASEWITTPIHDPF